jgi:hypothetical protein
MATRLPDATRRAILNARARGKSMGAIAVELGVSVGAVHKVCAGGAAAAQKGGAKAPARGRRGTGQPARSRAQGQPAGPPPETPPAGDPEAADELRTCVEAEGGDEDLGQLTFQIRRNEQFLVTVRAHGGAQAVVALERLIADLVERRRKLRPPPPPSDEDLQVQRARRRDELLARVERLVEAAEREAAKAANAESRSNASDST